MSKIAIVGCDSSGKTVFVSALTDFFKAGQRMDQTCALRASDSLTLNYTNQLHHRMRVLGRWPERTADEVEDARRLKWDMVTAQGPLTEIEMLDFAGENFRRAFNGQKNNAAYKDAVTLLLDYISQADFVVITVGLRNMIRSLRQELYKDLSRSEEEYQRDSEAQWVTTELLKLVANKMRTNPLSVVVALTQADRYRQELEEYGGAKGLFAKCWGDIAMLYPNLNVVSVASVDKVTAEGLPAKGYQTRGVLTVMKEFSRFAFGDCDEVTARLEDFSRRLSNMTDVGSSEDFSQLTVTYEKAIEELKSKTVVIQELYKEDVRTREAFLERCREFEEVIREVERRPSDVQANEGYWADQSRRFADFAGTVRGYARLYQRKVELARLEAEQLAEKARQAENARREAEVRRQEEERRAEMERQEKEARRAAEVQRIMAERQAEAERKKREAEELAEEKARQLAQQRQEEKIAREKSEREERERKDKTRAFVLRSAMVMLMLLVLGGAGGYWFSKENARKESALREEREALAKINAMQEADRLKRVRFETERANKDAEARKMEAALELAQVDAKVKDNETQLELARIRAKEAEEKRLAAKEEDERRRKEAEEERKREVAKAVDAQLKSLYEAVSADDLEGSRKLIASLRRGPLTSTQQGTVKFCEKFCNNLERAMNGDDSCQIWIAVQHSGQVTTIAQDNQRAKSWYEKAAEQGNTKALMTLATWAEQGVSGTRDLERAADLYEKAANGGDVDAMMKMAFLSIKGIGVQKDEAQVVRWYERAAKSNCGNAYYWLGVYSANGEMGMPKSSQAAHQLFLKAKQNGCKYTDPKSGVDAWLKVTKSK